MSLSLQEWEEIQASKKFENEEENEIIEKIDNPSQLSDFERMDIMEKVLIYMQTDWSEAVNFLEDTYSRLLFHQNIKEMTPRETILVIFDDIFKGMSGREYPYSSIKENNCYLQSLWNLYKVKMKESKFVVSKQQASYEYFKSFFENAFVVRDYRPLDFKTGKQLSAKKLVKNLPEFKENYGYLSVFVERERKLSNSIN